MTAQLRYVLRLADSNLVLAQRLGEWVGHAPALEEDLGLANVSLDLLGQARLLLAHAGELEGKGSSEDDLAYLREESEYLNLTLVEQPNGDFGQTIARQFLFDAWQLGLYDALTQSSDACLAAIAAKAIKETRYHLRYSGGWLVRLGDGTDESRHRAQQALERLWPFTHELFATDEVEREAARAGIGPEPAELEPSWLALVDEVLAQATLARPAASPFAWYGKQGRHGEHLGYLLAEMQSLHRAHPGASW
ncbi:MAG: 1,2-phenylacetyl-CoA epoxidase subunit PaaC [Gammaproteobacteria bacterium]